jgi:hypothetical protein
MVDQITAGETASWRGADKLQRIFGAIACDRSPEGYTFEMRRLPRCPECRKFFLKFDGYVDPVVIVDVAISSVSHVEWDGCTQEEKHLRVAAALLEIGSA